MDVYLVSIFPFMDYGRIQAAALCVSFANANIKTGKMYAHGWTVIL